MYSHKLVTLLAQLYETELKNVRIDNIALRFLVKGFQPEIPNLLNALDENDELVKKLTDKIVQFAKDITEDTSHA